MTRTETRLCESARWPALWMAFACLGCGASDTSPPEAQEVEASELEASEVEASEVEASEVEVAPEAPTTRVPLAGGRLFLLAAGPIRMREEVDVDVDARHEHHTELHFEIGDTRVPLELRSHDLLVPVPLTPAHRASMIPEDAIELPSSPGFRVVVTRSRPTRLIVLEDGRTAVSVTVDMPTDPPELERLRILRAFASRLRRGEPTPTTREWRIHVGNLQLDLSLPEGYAVWRDEFLFEGYVWHVADRVISPPASMRFEQAPPEEVRHRGPRRSVVVAGHRRPMVIERDTWSVNLRCACGEACWVELSGDEGERERLLQTLADARMRVRSCLQ